MITRPTAALAFAFEVIGNSEIKEYSDGLESRPAIDAWKEFFSLTSCHYFSATSVPREWVTSRWLLHIAISRINFMEIGTHIYCMK